MPYFHDRIPTGCAIMIRFVSSLCLVLAGLLTSAQSDVVDSLKNALLKEGVDTNRIKIKINLALELRYAGDTTYMPLVDEIIHEADEASRPDLQVRGLLEKGEFHDIRGNWAEARGYYKEAESLCREHGLERELGYTLFYQAGVARYSGEHRSAYDLYQKALDIFMRLKMEPQVATLIFSQAVILDNMGKFDEASVRFYDALKKYEQLSNSYGIGNCYNSLGLLVQRTEDYPRSMELYHKGLHYMKLDGAKSQVCNILDNIGVVHRLQNNLDSAIYYRRWALDGRREMGDKYSEGRGLINLADDLIAMGKYESAATELRTAVAIFREASDPQSLSLALTRLSDIEFRLGRTQDALKYAQEAVNLAQESHSPNEESAAQKHLAFVYERLGMYENAFFHFKEHEALSDSILSAESIANLNELQTKYDAAQKDQKILQQNLEIQSAEAEIKEQNLLYRLVGSSLIGALIVIVLLVLNYRQRSRLNKEKLRNLEQQKTVATMQAMIAGEERERSRIAKDLHDGLNGTLATVKMYMNGLPESAPALNSSEKFLKMKNILDDTTDEVRRISHDLMPSILLRDGLVVALQSYVTNINQAGLLQVELLITGMESRLDNRFELTLYRVIQELMNNIIKHAQASEVTIQLFRTRTELMVTVEDDGVGFDPKNNKGGIGLDSIQSRVKMLSGKSEIDSRPGKGTTVHMEFTLTKDQNSK